MLYCWNSLVSNPPCPAVSVERIVALTMSNTITLWRVGLRMKHFCTSSDGKLGRDEECLWGVKFLFAVFENVGYRHVYLL